jgi:hypothetical protein
VFALKSFAETEEEQPSFTEVDEEDLENASKV